MIYVDTAVGSNDLVEPLRKRGLPAVASPIVGDIMFMGRGPGDVPIPVCIEYKKLDELIGAIRSERLQGHQIPKMRATYGEPGDAVLWLLIEGELLTNDRGVLLKRTGRFTTKPIPGSMTLSELQKRLFGLHFNAGLGMNLVGTRSRTLGFIEDWYRFWTDEALDQHASHKAIYTGPPPAEDATPFQVTARTLPRLGTKNVLAAEKAFGGSLRKAFGATPTEWMQVPGIGKKAAADIMEWIA